MSKKTRILGGLLLALAGSASGQVYKWVDENGRVHYGARPPPAVKATALNYQARGVAPEANVEIEESGIEYYPVRGHTPLELHMSMVQNGPFNQIVQRRVYAEIVALATTITMPQWLDAATAPAETQALWPSVVAKIRQHEDGHKAIGVEGANVLARRLSALPAFDNCQALGAAIRSEGERVVGEYTISQSAFDRAEALKGSPFRSD